ncbi:MAG: beta strand repeat-containing protein, partial [Isosphaeraceae bacterium]
MSEPNPGDVARVTRATRAEGRRSAARRGLQPRLEWLEDRTLLNGTPIPADRLQAILAGTLAFSELGSRLDAEAALVNQPLDLLRVPAAQSGQPPSVTNLAALAPFGPTAAAIETAALNYTTLNPAPTFEGLEAAFRAAFNGQSDAVTMTLGANLVTYSFTNLRTSLPTQLGLNLGGRTQPVNLDMVSTDAPLNVAPGFVLPELSLNLERDTGRFYVNTPSVRYALEQAGLPGSFPVNTGFLGASALGATITTIAGPSSPRVDFRDPLGIGQLTTEEIQAYLDGTSPFRPFDDGSGSVGFRLTLPLSAGLGSFQTSTATPPTVTITDDDVLDGVAPTYAYASYDSLRPFDAVTSANVLHVVDQIILALERLAESSTFDAPIPFTGGKTVGEYLLLSEAIESTLAKNLRKFVVGADGTPVAVPTFATAQDLVAQLATILNVNPAEIDPSYDPATTELKFTVKLTTQNPAVALPFALNRPDLGVSLATSGNALSLVENGTLRFTFGVDLGTTSRPKLSTSSPAQGLAGPAIPSNGRLAGDSTFTLTDDQGTSTTVTVSAAATADNASPFDLADDFRAALLAAGLSNVTVGLEALSPRLTGDGPFPGDGRLTADSSFTVTIDRDAPVVVTVPRSATADNHLASDLVADYNAALAAAGITSVVAQIARPAHEIVANQPVPANGRLSNDATFTLTIDQAAPVTVVVTKAITDNNTTPSDLLNDLGAALRAAGLTNIVPGLRSRIVGGAERTVLTLHAVQPSLLGKLTLNTAANDPTATQLGFANGQVGDDVPSLAFSSTATNPVLLLSLTTATTDPLVNQFGFAPSQSAGFLSARLTLVPDASDFLKFNADANDPSVTQLGFANDQASRSSVVAPFLEGTSYDGAMTLATTPNPSPASGTYGFLGLTGDDLSATAAAKLDFTLKGFDGTPGGRLTIRELIADTAITTTTANLIAGSANASITGDPTGLAVGQGVRGPGLAPDTTITAISGANVTLSKAAARTVADATILVSDAPALVTTPTTTGSGSAVIGLNVPGLGVDSQSFSLSGAMADMNDPFTSFSLVTSGMGLFQNYQFLTFADVASGLQSLSAYLSDAGSFRDAAGTSLLTAPLPIVNRSVTDLTGYANPFAGFAAAMLATPTSTLQAFLSRARTLLGDVGTGATVAASPTGQGATTSLGLTYAFTLPNLLDAGLRLDLDGIPTLVSLATGTNPSDAANLAGVTRIVDTSALATTVLPARAAATFNLTMGFDLSQPASPSPFLLGGADLATLRLNVNATGLQGVPLSIGRIGLFGDGVSASVNGGNGATSPATFTLTVGSTPGTRVPLNPSAQANARASVLGQAGVTLPVSLVPTGGSTLSPPLTIQVTSLAGLLDGVPGSVAPILAPSLTGYDDLIEMIQKTPNLTAGINKYLIDFQNALNSEVLGLSFPVVGTQLLKVGQIFDDFRVALSFQVGQDAYTGDPIASIQNTMFQIFGSPGLGWLVNSKGGPGTLADVIVNTDDKTYVNWSAHLHVAPTLSTTQIGFDVGLPGLQMDFPTDTGSTLNTVDLQFGFDLVFNFGIDVNDGFYVATSPDDPLTVTFDAVPHVDPTTNQPAPMSGTFGFFNIDATPDKNPALYADTRFQGTATVTVNGGATVPNRLVYKDLIDDKFSIDPKLDATGTANLALVTSYPNSNFSLEILTDFEMMWTFAASDPDLRGSQPLLGFYGIGTNWSNAVERFLGPAFGKLGQFLNTEPIGPILDFLGAPLPVLSYLLGPTDLVQFLGLLAGGPGSSAAFQALLDAVDLYRGLSAAVPTGGYASEYDLKIDQGDMVITQDVRSITSLNQITGYTTPRDPTLAGFIDQIDAYEADPKNKEFTTDDDGGIISGKLTRSFNIGLTNFTIQIPFFSDPKFVKTMLLGHPGDLFYFVSPSASFTIQAEIDFPPIPIGPIPLVIMAGGSIQPTIQFGFGFDTRGYDLAAEGHVGNIGDESFFFLVNTSDQAGTVLDVPLKLFFGASTGIPDVVTVGVDIYFLWDNQLGLKDLNGDGRV